MSRSLKMAEQPRASCDTDQRYLLAESVCPSESASVITITHGDGDQTPRGDIDKADLRHQSIATPEQAHRQDQYRGFTSEQAYIDALRAWAEAHKYTAPTEASVFGFYGATTMEEYASRPSAMQPLGIRKKWKALKASKEEQKLKRMNERRATVA